MQLLNAKEVKLTKYDILPIINIKEDRKKEERDKRMLGMWSQCKLHTASTCLHSE